LDGPAGSTAFGGVAAFGSRNDEALLSDELIKLVEFVALSPDFANGSLSSGAIFTPPS
jgi:hypothetical protein